MAQLLIIPRDEEWDICTITDAATLHQIVRVLRMRTNEMLFLQDISWSKRYKVAVEHIDKNSIRTRIHERIVNQDQRKWSITLMLAMPNKFDKLELIVQKTAEIGLDRLICRPSQRSILKDLPEKKMARLQTIAREATEQSWWRKIPEIQFSSVFPQIKTDQTFLFDYHERLTSKIPGFSTSSYIHKPNTTHTLWIVWPEGGFTEDEIQWWGTIDAQISLGNQVLRMETAAIVGGWWMKNQVNS